MLLGHMNTGTTTLVPPSIHAIGLAEVWWLSALLLGSCVEDAARPLRGVVWLFVLWLSFVVP